VHGFQTALEVLGGLLLVGILVTAVLLRPVRERAEDVEALALQEAA